MASFSTHPSGTPAQQTDYRPPRWSAFVFGALLFHAAIALFLALAREPKPVLSPANTSTLAFRLIPPPEGEAPIYMASSQPDVMPPTGQDNKPDFEARATGEAPVPQQSTDNINDADLSEILARERDALRKELEQSTRLAQATPLPQAPLPAPPITSGNQGGTAPGPEGAIRELDLEGYSQAIVDDIMKRYNLKIVTQQIEAGRRGQSFLSSASRGSSERFFGGMTVEAGVYEVFQLSRGSVALMSRLEEKALRDRNMEPLKSRIIKIVFGIVKDGKGGYELGVKSLEAEAVEP